MNSGKEAETSLSLDARLATQLTDALPPFFMLVIFIHTSLLYLLVRLFLCCCCGCCCCCCCCVTSVVSDSVRPHRWQPTRPPHSWDSPGKDAGVGCHFLLQCMKVKSESEVAQSCPILSDHMDCSPPGSSVHGIFPGKSTGVGCHRLL